MMDDDGPHPAAEHRTIRYRTSTDTRAFLEGLLAGNATVLVLVR